MECVPLSSHLLQEAWPAPPAATSAPNPLQPHCGQPATQVPIWPCLCDGHYSGRWLAGLQMGFTERRQAWMENPLEIFLLSLFLGGCGT